MTSVKFVFPNPTSVSVPAHSVSFWLLLVSAFSLLSLGFICILPNPLQHDEAGSEQPAALPEGGMAQAVWGCRYGWEGEYFAREVKGRRWEFKFIIRHRQLVFLSLYHGLTESHCFIFLLGCLIF